MSLQMPARHRVEIQLVAHQETVHVSVALRSATRCYGALLRRALFSDAGTGPGIRQEDT